MPRSTAARERLRAIAPVKERDESERHGTYNQAESGRYLSQQHHFGDFVADSANGSLISPRDSGGHCDELDETAEREHELTRFRA